MTLRVDSGAAGSAGREVQAMPFQRKGRSPLAKVMMPLAFMAPAVLLIAGVNLYPALYGIVTSLFDTRYAQRVGFAGLSHYLELMRDDRAIQALKTSLFFVSGSVSCAILVGLGLALLVARPWPLRPA